ncbi:MAG: hypothetical protein ABMB14_02075 [Myxococcota bacterium]
MTRPTLALLALAGSGGCMFGPYDGQVVSGSTTAISAWGAHNAPATQIQVEARWPADNRFYTYTTATTVNGAYAAFGTNWYYWSVSAPAPSWAWRTGVTGKRAEVRSRSGGTMLNSFPAGGLDCMLAASVAGTNISEAQWACGSAATPSAFVFTADYRGMPTFTPQAPVDYPQELEHDRVNNIQGPASTATHWYFTHNDPELVKIPLTSDLDDGDTWSDAEAVGMPEDLDDLGYDHFGDPDEYGGNLYVPVEDMDEDLVGAIAQFDLNLGFRGYATLPGIKASWVAIDPTTGLLYTSAFCDVHTVDVYTMQFDQNGTLTNLVLTKQRPLWTASSVAVTLQQIQGGGFSDRGNLFLVSDARNGACPTPGTAGVYGFEGATLRQEAYFDVPYVPGDGEELEGIDIRDVTGVGTPGITGQVHLVMLDNEDWWDVGDDDDLYFKHYAANPAELGFL